MKRSTTIVLGAVIVAAIAVGLGVYLATSQPRLKEFKIETREFGYNGPSGGPTLTVKAGETVRITLVNKGAVDHEFRLVKDKDAFLSDVQKAVEKLQAQGIKDEEGVENAPAFKEARRLQGMQLVQVGGELDWDVDVEPGETRTFELVITTPGTYWYVCGELDATFPQIHAQRGMFAQIIVQP